MNIQIFTLLNKDFTNSMVQYLHLNLNFRLVWGGGELRERDSKEDPGVAGRIILRWIFRKWDGGHGLDLSGSE